MADIGEVLEKYADKMNDNSPEPVETTSEEPVEVRSNDIINSGELNKSRLYSYFDVDPQSLSADEDKMIQTIYDYLSKMGGSIESAARELEMIIGSPGGMGSRLESFYKHIRLNEAINAVKDSNSGQQE